MPVIYPSPAALTLANHVDELLADATLKLYKNNVTLTPATVVGDLEEADFSGYADVALPDGFGTAYYPASGNGAEIRSGEFQFNFENEVDPDDNVTNVVYGFYILLDGGQLYVVGSYDEPVPMAEVGHACFVDVILGYGANE